MPMPSFNGGMLLRQPILLILVLLTIPPVEGSTIPPVEGLGENEGCSFHQGYSCDPYAVCTDISSDPIQWECACPDDMFGDGYIQNGVNNTGCDDGQEKCKFDNDCHSLAECNDVAICECVTGYQGDGINECLDINECTTISPCHQHANCTNTEGSFICVCKEWEHYVGDGFTCRQQCNVDHDCPQGKDQKCSEDEICVCNDGFVEVIDQCQDIDECLDDTSCNANADCTNEHGSYSCECRNGYEGDGFICTPIARNCQEILDAEPKSRSGEYEIDPDGPGYMGRATVQCEMRPGLGITVFPTTLDKYYGLYWWRSLYTVAYVNNITTIRAVANNSGYCVQYIKYIGRNGGALMDDNDGLYHDDYIITADDRVLKTFGGSPVSGTCACGALNYCKTRTSKCNCDGSPEPCTDDGKIIDKDQLPLKAVRVYPNRGGYGAVLLGPVQCAQVSFDVPKNCDEAKFNPNIRLRKNSPYVVDFDQEGPLHPVLAYCDVESYDHVGITILNTFDNVNNVTEAGTHNVSYHTARESMDKLVEISAFCTQEVSYESKNSRLLNGGDKKVWLTDIQGDVLDYWPGALQHANVCACGVLGICDDNTLGCNSDAMDGKVHLDLGKIYHKEDLPIGSITLTEDDILNADSWRSYKIGPLKCADREFGIAPTCQQYVEEGHVDSHVYLIDGDGPPDPRYPDRVNYPGVLVYCDISLDPPYGTTVVYHNQTEQIVVTEDVFHEFHYLEVSIAQLELLVTRSTYCTQTFDYECIAGAQLHSSDPGVLLSSWTSLNGRQLSYYGGNGTAEEACACALTSPSTCESADWSCNCDAPGSNSRFDNGTLINKDDLPMMKINFTNFQGVSLLKIGPLRCMELFRNCGEKKVFNSKYRLAGEPVMQSGPHTIFPTTEGDVGPFVVECLGTKTIIQAHMENVTPTVSDPNNGVSKCYEINYRSNEWNVTREQVQALVASSSFCGQQLSQSSLNAPLTGHSNYSTCDGVMQIGWAGSLGRPSCACGVAGACEDPSALCHSDLVDGKMKRDGDWIQKKSRLAVCQVCVALDPAELLLGISPKYRSVIPTVSDLFCDIGGIGQARTCHDWRDMGITQSDTLSLRPRGFGHLDPFPVSCIMYSYPPMGITEIRPREPRIPLTPGVTLDVEILYYAYSVEMLAVVVKQAHYCTQELYIECDGSSLEFGGTHKYGWYSRNGKPNFPWAGNYEGTATCAGGECKCNSGGIATDGGLIVDTDSLPVSRVKLGPASGNRTLVVGSVKCYDVYSTCHEIHKHRAKTNPMRNNTYAINPDQSGRLEPFAVECDFTTNRAIGITKVTAKTSAGFVRNFVMEGSYQQNITYKHADYQQINKLADVSEWCLQSMQFLCVRTPLITSDARVHGYSVYGGEMSTSFGAAGNSDIVGCACLETGTCTEDSPCHCDGTGYLKVDQGFETNRAVLPIQGFTFGNQTSPLSSAAYTVSDVWCGPQPFYLPEDCDAAYKMEYKTGEVLIWPASHVEPFLVYCDMDGLVPDGGVTIVNSHQRDGQNVTYGEFVDVTYYRAEYTQLRALIGKSAFCYQPFTYTCQKTIFLDVDDQSLPFFWTGAETPHFYAGGAQRFSKGCSCGATGHCGGNETRDVLQSLNRQCNCDAADDELRADSGILSFKLDLPMEQLFFGETGLNGSYGHVTVGSLYCAEKEFDLNECTLGFHDCHPNANCINMEGTYDCYCWPGYRGLGRPDVWANGRNCYDDDECALKMCPPDRAYCTNFPGGYNCTCKPGYIQRSKHQCDDIDECAENTHNCSENARCINLIGSYDCRCNFNYRGDGFTCLPMATCSGFGDPHILTFDGALVNYQGLCQYVMSRDRCDALGEEPTFQLLATFYDRGATTDLHASWIKQITFQIEGYEIILRQGGQVRVNGRNVNMPYISGDVHIREFGKYIEIYTNIGIEVTWDSKESVQLHAPGQWQGQTCGLCGNYNWNPNDDMMIGPGCSAEAGSLTANPNIFGESWVVPSVATENPECAADCDSEDDMDLCTGPDRQLAEAHCDRLFDPNGKFKECLKEIDSGIVDSLHYSCIYDLCRADGDPGEDICDYAETLYTMCKLNSIPMESFRTKDFCAPNCPDNMEYSPCVTTTQLTCLDVITNNTEMTDTEQCQEGCFCKEGFVKNTGSCVNVENCGCSYDGQYYGPGEEVALTGCNKVGKCKSNNNMEITELVCHKDATCSLKDGEYGCHCNDDFYGDGHKFCVVDPCLSSPCGVNETCLKDPDVDVGYECRCSSGFIGECNNCTEINECKLYDDLCPMNSKCINTVASYACICEDGYTLFNGECQDINECAMAEGMGVEQCGNNSQCLNLIGDYDCPCCEGFEKDAAGNCVETTDGSGGTKCCVCEIDICDAPGEVCGEDGNQYESIRDMILHRCELGLQAQVQEGIDYFGACKSSCANVQCPKYQECVIHPATGAPTCECTPCTEAETKSKKVCTSNLDMYPNLCIFKLTQCLLNHEAVPLDSLTPCEDKIGESPVGEWGAWGECSVECGKGTREKLREAYTNLSPADQQRFPLSLPTECYMEPCQDSVCLGYICTSIFAECVEIEPGTATCECPSCTNMVDEKVCGFVQLSNGDIVIRQYESSCHLRKSACENNYMDAGVINEGHCGLDPRNCSRVPEKTGEFIYGGPGNNYRSAKKFRRYGCLGFCNDVQQDCCRIADTKKIEIELFKQDDNRYSVKEEVEVVKSCECVDPDQVAAP